MSTLSLVLAAVLIQTGQVQVVTEKGAAPTVRFAAKELSTFLGQTLGAEVPVVGAPAEAGVSIILGNTSWSRAEGLDPKPLVRDGFWRLAKGNRIYLVGSDDPHYDVEKIVTDHGNESPMRERATLYAVYDFLEKFADCRFLFPGECGTAVPRL